MKVERKEKFVPTEEIKPSYEDYILLCSNNFVLSAFKLMDMVKAHPLMERQFASDIESGYYLRLSETRINLRRAIDHTVVAYEKREDQKAIAKLLAKYLKIKIDEWNSKEE